MGDDFRESELINLVIATDAVSPPFDIAPFLVSSFRHAIYMFLSPLIAVPIVFLTDRCRCTANWNHGFIIIKNAFTLCQFTLAMLSSASSAMLIVGIARGDVHWLDHFDFFMIVWARIFVVSGKFGFYARAHQMMYEQC